MQKIKIRPIVLIVASLALLWLAFMGAVGNGKAAPQVDAAAVELVAGSYEGSVTVSEPAPLGDLALLIEITGTNGVLSGQVNAIKTQVFLGSPTLTGQVTTGQDITPTLRIASETFSGNISGRTVQRSFLLTGQVLDNGDTLEGDYTETILGFNPQPLQVKGKFMLVRPEGLTRIITVPAPNGSTPTATPTLPGSGGGPTATPTATPTPPGNPGNGLNNRIYLPVINR